MKTKKYSTRKGLLIGLSLILCQFSLSIALMSCSEEDLGPSIYDTTDYPLDRSAYTFPLDTFVKKNFIQLPQMSEIMAKFAHRNPQICAI